MKDHRFIELLNLYIDRQITVAETAELEAEIQQNPKRQAVYRQYCQIHSATKLVYDSFRANATEQPVLPTDRTGVVELFETKRRKSQFVYYAGGLAAAACAAFVLMRSTPTPNSGAPMLTAKTAVAPVAVATTAPVEAAPVPVKATEQSVGLVSLRNSTASTPDYLAMLAAMREQDEERAFANRHLQANPTPSLFDDGVFDASRPTQDPRLFRARPATPAQQQAEFTAFQFQR